MASKKIEEMLANLEKVGKETIEKEFLALIKKLGKVYYCNDELTNIVVHCFDCLETTLLPINTIPKNIKCKNCGNSTHKTTYKELNHYERISFRKIFNVRFMCKFDSMIVIKYYEKKVNIYDDNKIHLSEMRLDKVLLFDTQTSVVSYYERGVNDAWSKKTTSPYTYYNRNINTFIYDSIDTYNEFSSLKFVKEYHINDSTSLHNLLSDYKEFAAKNGISKTKKKTEAVLPELPEIDDNLIISFTPMLPAFKVKEIGLIEEHTCMHCGKTFIKQKNNYGMPNVCNCVENPDYNYRDITLIESFLQEDKSIVFRISENNVFQKKGLSTYCPTVKSKSVSLYIYATKDEIFFFNEKKKNCSLSDLSPKINSLNYSYWYRNLKIKTFSKSDEEFLADIQNSVIGRIGLIEIIKNNPERIKAETFLEYINFFELYNKSKNVEQIAKLNMKTLLKDLCKKVSIPKIINKKEIEASKIFGLTPYQLKQVRQADASLKTVERYKKVLENDPNVLFEDCKILLSEEIFPKYEESLRLEVPNLNSNAKKFASYLQSLDDYQCMGIYEGICLWIDYITMSKELKCDLKDKTLVFTNSLKLNHDRTVKKYNNLKDKLIIKTFDEAISRYAHLSYENDDFIARPPVSQEELYEEGRKLNHCVGTYAKSVAEGRSIIMFVRSKENPDTPLVTVEISKSSIVQAKGKYNVQANRIIGMKKFLTEWTEEKKLAIKHY